MINRRVAMLGALTTGAALLLPEEVASEPVQYTLEQYMALPDFHVTRRSVQGTTYRTYLAHENPDDDAFVIDKTAYVAVVTEVTEMCVAISIRKVVVS